MGDSEDPQRPIPEQKTSICNKCESLPQSHCRQLEKNPPRNDKSCCYLLVICILVAILAIFAVLLLDSQDKLANCQNEKKTKIEELNRLYANKISSFKEKIAQTESQIETNKNDFKMKSEMKELNHETCKQEKAECINEKEELRKGIEQLSEQKAALNLNYTTCDFERPAHRECKDDKKKCLKEIHDLNEFIDKLKSDIAALDVKYAKCDTHRDDFEQCKVERRELEHNYKTLEAELRALNIEAVRLNITHSYDNKEIKTCDRRLHDSNVKMLEYMEKYVTCLKDKDSTNTEPQKICKVELAECLANLRQVIDTSSECQEKIARCIWC